MAEVGDTILWEGGGGCEHLYIVLNDPAKFDGQAAVVNLTHSTGGPKAFTMKVGDHPYITKPSDINFGDASIFDDAHIEGEKKCYNAIPNAQMDAGWLQKIAAAALDHPGPSRDFKRIIKAQWNL